MSFEPRPRRSRRRQRWDQLPRALARYFPGSGIVPRTIGLGRKSFEMASASKSFRWYANMSPCRGKFERNSIGRGVRKADVRKGWHSYPIDRQTTSVQSESDGITYAGHWASATKSRSYTCRNLFRFHSPRKTAFQTPFSPYRQSATKDQVLAVGQQAEDASAESVMAPKTTNAEASQPPTVPNTTERNAEDCRCLRTAPRFSSRQGSNGNRSSDSSSNLQYGSSVRVPNSAP